MPPTDASPPPPRVVVVDQHHDALPPLWDATDPGEDGGADAGETQPHHHGHTLVHLDSHPDLACLDNTAPHALLRRVAGGGRDVEVARLHARCHIASWILPLVLAGRVDRVVWISGWWCQQMDPGTYHLRVGIENHRLKVGAGTSADDAAAAGGDDPEEGCAPYWQSARRWAGGRRLQRSRPWTLHVVRWASSSPESPGAGADVARVAALVRDGRPWLLDIDEDFYSCANPYHEEFVALFGDRTAELLRDTYDPAEDAATHWDTLREVLAHGLHRLSPEAFAQHRLVRRLAESTAPETLEAFRDWCHGTERRPPRASGSGSWTVSRLFGTAAVHDAGEATGLPHHVSGADDLVRLLNATERLLAALPAPRAVTVATSRMDRYVPAAQAERLHAAVCGLLMRRYRVPLRDLERRDAVPHAVPLRTQRR